MDDNVYGFKNGNALDRIAHALHMQETWSNAAKVYKKLIKKKTSKNTQKLCSCKEEAIPNIVDEETWKTWKTAMYSNMDQDKKDEISYNFAQFMNCKLNRLWI
jgi:hypothetical protein